MGQRGSCRDLCLKINVFCLCFPLSFIVSSLTYRSLIHFELIFVYSVRKSSNFILLHVAAEFHQHHLLKRLSFFFLMSLAKELSILVNVLKEPAFNFIDFFLLLSLFLLHLFLL